MSPGARPAVFLDRDGTINVEVEGALADPADVELIPGSAAAIARLNAAGFATVCVTNQSAIGRGWMTEEDFTRVQAHLERLLAAEDARLDLVLHCPHHPTEGLGEHRRACRCRKPGPGMLERAIEVLGIDPARSWLVGDAARDLEAARAAGVRSILVGTGKGTAENERLRAAGAAPARFARDLAEAVELVLSASPAA